MFQIFSHFGLDQMWVPLITPAHHTITQLLTVCSNSRRLSVKTGSDFFSSNNKNSTWQIGFQHQQTENKSFEKNNCQILCQCYLSDPTYHAQPDSGRVSKKLKFIEFSQHNIFWGKNKLSIK